uniref:hypothetical protein n=1 Tax=Natronorubrum tibetense TaxID=63128 RepID=UPI00146E4103
MQLPLPWDGFQQCSVQSYRQSQVSISWGVGFTLLTATFSRFIWKTRIARVTGASKVPDFSGEWTGYVKTSYEGVILDEALHASNDPTRNAAGRSDATNHSDMAEN